jgi:hypothetical protein
VTLRPTGLLATIVDALAMSRAMRLGVMVSTVALAALAGCGDEPAALPTTDAGDAGRTDLGDMDAGLGADAGSPMDAGVEDTYDPCNPRLRLGDGGTAFEPDPRCPLPNLIPVIERVQIQTRTFAAGSCEVMEGCTMPGRRRLLRFDLITPNIGAGDLYLGPPLRDNRPDGRFEYGACHAHYHFRGYADYRLMALGADTEVARGHKQSFCLLDSARYMDMGRALRPGEVYTCTDQGIHAGWYDLYDRALDCQYVDITDVPPGRYRVRVRINELRGLTETSYDDNEAFREVEIPATDPVSNDPTDACGADADGAERDCGWTIDRALTCTPGTRVTVGCNASCGAGSCAGNPVIRVCAGDGPCRHSAALAENDDACGNSCPSVSFMCPPFRNRYTVMTGGSRAGGAYECRLEASEARP